MFVQGLITEWLEMKIKGINKMSKKFTYTKFTKYCYCGYSDEWEEDGIEFDYEVEDKDLLPVIVDLLFEDYFGKNELYCNNKEIVKSLKENLTKMIKESDLIETFADQYEDELKEIFKKEALDFFID